MSDLPIEQMIAAAEHLHELCEDGSRWRDNSVQSGDVLCHVKALAAEVEMLDGLIVAHLRAVFGDDLEVQTNEYKSRLQTVLEQIL